MEQGWISLYRKMWDNPAVTKDAEHVAVWVWLLTHATHQPYDVMIGDKRVTLQPGQMRVSRKTIAEELHISSSKVQRILKLFEIEQQIEQQTDNRSRVITIVSWGLYQKSEQQSEQQLNSNWTASEQQVNPNNNTIIKKHNNKIKNSSSTTNIWNSLSQDDFATIEERFGADRAVELVDLVHEEVDRYGRHVEKPLQYVLSYAERKGIK